MQATKIQCHTILLVFLMLLSAGIPVAAYVYQGEDIPGLLGNPAAGAVWRDVNYYPIAGKTPISSPSYGGPPSAGPLTTVPTATVIADATAYGGGALRISDHVGRSVDDYPHRIMLATGETAAISGDASVFGGSATAAIRVKARPASVFQYGFDTDGYYPPWGAYNTDHVAYATTLGLNFEQGPSTMNPRNRSVMLSVQRDGIYLTGNDTTWVLWSATGMDNYSAYHTFLIEAWNYGTSYNIYRDGIKIGSTYTGTGGGNTSWIGHVDNVYIGTGAPQGYGEWDIDWVAYKPGRDPNWVPVPLPGGEPKMQTPPPPPSNVIPDYNYSRPREVGAWYITMYTKNDEFGHWAMIENRGGVMPTIGRFGAGDPAIIAAEYAKMRDCGISFLVMDDTNTIGVDSGLIEANIKAWYDFMDAKPAGERIPIAIALGGELNQHNNRPAWLGAVDYVWSTYANRPSYLRVDGKPVLNWYIETDYWDDWADSRWTIRRTYHFFRMDGQRLYGGWGFGSDGSDNDFTECHSFFPGWDLSPPGYVRRGGGFYTDRWFNALKVRPEYVLLSDWNGWLEGTSFGDSYSWTDTYGTACTTFYRQMTKAYVAAFRNQLLDGVTYREPGRGRFLWSNKQLVPVTSSPHGAALIILPRGQLAALANANGWITKRPNEVKGLVNGATVNLTGVVSAIFDGCFYIQDANRTTGVRISTRGFRPTLGETVSVVGSLRTIGGERYIEAVEVFEATD